MEKTRSELCLECMECCKVFRVRIDSYLLRSIDLFEARGFRVLRYLDILWLVIPHVCNQLGENGCRIYKNRPLDCQYYDGRGDPAVNCRWKD